MPTGSKPKWKRWVPIIKTTPSGKTLFVCLVCGETGPIPVLKCVESHDTRGQPVYKDCHTLEEQINGTIETSLDEPLFLEWAESQLRPNLERNCEYCRGYGCQVCMGSGKRWRWSQ